MAENDIPVSLIYRGWDSHQIALVHAISPLTPAQLAFKAAPQLRSVAEITRHIADARLAWFQRISGTQDLLNQRIASQQPAHDSATDLSDWLESTWWLIDQALSTWTLADLDKTYHQPYMGQNFAVPYQWVLWRLLSHEIHHGGEISLMLGMQGLKVAELGDQGGHTTPLRAIPH